MDQYIPKGSAYIFSQKREWDDNLLFFQYQNSFENIMFKKKMGMETVSPLEPAVPLHVFNNDQ